MSVKVAKFGGTSLANAEQFQKVYSIIRSDRARRFVIPSAPGKRTADDSKITDLFYLCHAHVQRSIPFDEVYSIIAQRYREIVAKLSLSLDIEHYLQSIAERISQGASLDYTVSRGEFLNALILAELLEYPFVDAAELICFDHTGRFNQEETQKRIEKRLGRLDAAVIPGFYGATPDGRIKVFPRGGSDITGALIACGVGAEVYENWTDVSGFLMADPRIVPNPQPIGVISYQELRELAYMGANVLHEASVFPVRQVGIPVNIKNTNEPDHPGTLIVSEVPPGSRANSITGIAGHKDFAIISIEKALMNTEVGFVRRLLSILEYNLIPFEHIPSGIDTVSLIILKEHLQGKIDDVLLQIERDLRPDRVEVHDDIALVATVGHGMVYTPGIAARLFAALAEAKINVRMIDQGSSEINIIIGVNCRDFEASIRAIYNAFVSETPTRL